MRVLIAMCVLVTSTLFAQHAVAKEEWTPPENPDPQKIMWEAREDATAGRYEVALAKQLWFHDHAIAIRKSLSGVRRSFALSHWLELGEIYPPALEKMKQVREETEKRVRDQDQVRIQFDDFHDLVALNRTLREEERTAETFLWLDETDEEDAERLFHIAEPALIKQQAYEVCGKYVDPEKDIARIGSSYTMNLKMARERFDDSHREFAEKRFLNAVTTLVAILVQNDRQAEADEVAENAKTFVEDADLLEKLDTQLESALEGTVPKPWP